MEAGGGSALPCDTLDGVMLRCSKRGWPRKAAHAGKAELKAHEKASSYKELDDTQCDPRKSRAIPCARVDCCNAKSCDVPHAVRLPGARMAPISSSSAWRHVCCCRNTGAKARTRAGKRAGRGGPGGALGGG